MTFKQKYIITPRYLKPGTRRRPGVPVFPAVKFIVAHDTGNPGSTASGNVRYYQDTSNEVSASAHLFVDDKEIIECIPALTTDIPEKAWHVLYKVTTDDQMYGYNANDAAIAVEYCYGGNINADDAYRKYIWVIACLCYRFNLDPRISVIGHHFLDPLRKTDPLTGLAKSRRSYDQLLKDIVSEYNECLGFPPPEYHLVRVAGTTVSTVKLNIRKGLPTTLAEIVQVVPAGTTLPYEGYVNDGEAVNGNPKWYKDPNGNFFWSGGVTPLNV